MLVDNGLINDFKVLKGSKSRILYPAVLIRVLLTARNRSQPKMT